MLNLYGGKLTMKKRCDGGFKKWLVKNPDGVCIAKTSKKDGSKKRGGIKRARRMVWENKAYKTAGNLVRSDLVLDPKTKEIKSKKAVKEAKKRYKENKELREKFEKKQEQLKTEGKLTVQSSLKERRRKTVRKVAAKKPAAEKPAAKKAVAKKPRRSARLEAN